MMVITLPLTAAPEYIDAAVSFAYTPQFEALKHPYVTSSSTYSYGPVKSLALKVGVGSFYPWDTDERTGLFGKYFYSSMDDSDFQAVMLGVESKFFYVCKVSFGLGYTWFDKEIPYDVNYPDDKSDFSSFNITTSFGLEFNITDNFMIGGGVEYLPRGIDWRMLRATRGTYYFEVTQRLK